MLTEPQPVTNASETPGEANAATTLAVDIGGSGIKVILLDATGVPNLEMAHHRFRKTESYEDQLGRAALEKVGKEKWNRRLKKAIDALEHLFNYDRLYIGGGDTKNITLKLPSNIEIVPNVLGLLGGIALWQD